MAREKPAKTSNMHKASRTTTQSARPMSAPVKYDFAPRRAAPSNISSKTKTFDTDEADERMRRRMESFDDANGNSSESQAESSNEDDEGESSSDDYEEVIPKSKTHNKNDNVERARVRNRMEAFDDASGASESEDDDEEEEEENDFRSTEYTQDSDSGSSSASSSDADSDDATDMSSESEAVIGRDGGHRRREVDSANMRKGDQKEPVELINNKTRVAFRGDEREDIRAARTASAGKDLPLSERLRLQQRLADESAMFAEGQGGKKVRKVLSARQLMKKRRQEERNKSEGDYATAATNPFVKKSDAIEHEQPKKKKNGPAEMPSNKPVRRFRDVTVDHTLHRKPSVDPRFSELTGQFKEKHFYKNYDFLDKYQEDEIAKLEKAAKKSKGEDRKSHLKEELRQRKQNMQERRRALATKEKLDALWQAEKEKVAQGKKAFFLKKSARKEVAMGVKFDELKKTGKLKSYMAKRRTKNAKKDHRWIPTAREQS